MKPLAIVLGVLTTACIEPAPLDIASIKTGIYATTVGVHHDSCTFGGFPLVYPTTTFSTGVFVEPDLIGVFFADGIPAGLEASSIQRHDLDANAGYTETRFLRFPCGELNFEIVLDDAVSHVFHATRTDHWTVTCSAQLTPDRSCDTEVEQSFSLTTPCEAPCKIISPGPSLMCSC
jgi:hypothetical protein